MNKKKTDKYKKLKKIRDTVWNLTSSPLYKYRMKMGYYPVLGAGNHDADIMFIGEAPGKNEAETGRPFCGQAGKILTFLLSYIGLSRKDVYITNIVKDRPPSNRDPTSEEIDLYAPFLIQQISIINPKVIATLGRFSMAYLLDYFHSEKKSMTITKLHGTIIPITASFGKFDLVPLYHPAVALYNNNQLPILKKDFEVLKKYSIFQNKK